MGFSVRTGKKQFSVARLNFRERQDGSPSVHLMMLPNPDAERVIGSIRRECLNHLIVINKDLLRRILRDYFRYYHCPRTHLSLCKDAPEPRAKQPPEC